MTLRISLDRDLPVPVGAQLKGQIEYGIVSGALKPGEQLPSVRELAAAEGLAHVTVSHVYSALKREGLIVVRQGTGTYVAGDGGGPRAGGSLGELQYLVEAMVAQARGLGFTPAQISQMVTARLAGGGERRPLIAMVGLFGHATEVYARELGLMLEDLDPLVVPYTVERLRAGGAEERDRVCEADLILTLANKVKEVQKLLARRRPPIRSLSFVAHAETVRRLQALAVDLQIGVISTFAEFLPTMLNGVMAYAAPSKPPLCAVLSDGERVNAVLAQADAVIYASGSEAIRAHVSRTMPVIEYLHAPELASVEAVRPLLERLSPARHAEGRVMRQPNSTSRLG